MDWNRGCQKRRHKLTDFSLLNWREWIETGSISPKTIKNIHFSLLNWREWIETIFPVVSLNFISAYFSLLNWREWIETFCISSTSFWTSHFSLLNWREWIETVDLSNSSIDSIISLFLIEESGLKLAFSVLVWSAASYFSLLNWREWIETSYRSFKCLAH